VLQLAQLYGWRAYHTLNSKGSEPGFPDLVLVRPPELLVVELKTDKGRVRPAQREWLDALELGAAAAGGTVRVDVWRPCDFDRVHGLLRTRGAA
jgi:VRR-NUC domain